MKVQDWHTHNKMCHHAIGSLEDYVKKAINLKLDTVGFSDHFPFDYLKGIEGLPVQDYAMVLEEIEIYLSSVESLREKFKSEVNIKLGFEIDYIEGQVDRLNVHLNDIKPRLDYILGSVHVLYTKEGIPWGMDDSRFSKQYKSLGTDNVYLQYYEKLDKMINSPEFDFDIVSHFDIPKKFNKLPNEKEKIWNKLSKDLESIKKKGLVVEINTAGLRKKVKEQYPSNEILKKMYELDIPVLLGSDAHDPNEIAFEFNSIIKLLKSIGYNQLAGFDKRKRYFLEI
jgi:histidinol-phosphatase (PHP family)